MVATEMGIEYPGTTAIAKSVYVFKCCICIYNSNIFKNGERGSLTI